MKRRSFLERVPVLAALAMLSPAALLAAWNEKYFQKVPLEKAFENVLGTKDLVKTDRITIAAPPVASDSTAVPVEVSSSIMGDHLYLFVEKNLTPLVFSCALHAGAIPSIALNIKMKESSLLYGVVRDGGKFYAASIHVDVSAQAC
jgi:sulfur-oxidizing protein SoxY